MIVQVGVLVKEQQFDGLKFAVYVFEGRNIVAGWRTRKVIIDGEELNDNSLLTYLNARKVQLMDDATAVITTNGVSKSK